MRNNTFPETKGGDIARTLETKEGVKTRPSVGRYIPLRETELDKRTTLKRYHEE